MATLPIETDIETISFKEITIANYKDILQRRLGTILDSLYWIKNYSNTTLTIGKQTTITDNSGTHTVIRPKKTTTKKERIGNKIDKYLLESITAAILAPSITIGKTIKEILPIDKNLSYKKQLELYGRLGKIIEDMKLMKKTTSEIQVEILNILISLQVLYTLSTKDFNKLVSFELDKTLQIEYSLNSLILPELNLFGENNVMPANTSAGGSSIGLTGLETCLSVKKNHMDSVYFYDVSHKKPKRPVVSDTIDSSAGPLSMNDLVGSITSNTSGLSDVENMKNMIPPSGSCALVTHNFNSTKSFALDIKLFVVSGKSISDKLISIKKIFYRVNGFGGVFISSKFLGIIRSLFTFEFSMNRAKELGICEKIVVNNNLRKVSSHLDKEIIVKKILVDLPKLAVKSVFFKFKKIVSIKMQLIGLWQKSFADLVMARWSVFMEKDSVLVVKAIDDKQSWVFRDLHQALLYTLPVSTIAHDFSDLLELYDEKTCFIGYNPSSYVYNRCAIVCFTDEPSKLAAIGSTSVFKGVFLWLVVPTVNNLVMFLMCVQLVPVVHLVSFISSSVDLLSSVKPLVMASSSLGNFDLADHMASLECFMELLSDQISEILKKLSFVKLVPLLSPSNVPPNCVVVPLSPFLLVVGNAGFELSLNGSKILTTKVGGLESKMMALEVSVGLVLAKLDFLCSSLGFNLVWKVAICNVKGMNNLAKQDNIIHWHKDMNNLISIVTETKLKSKVCFWIMNKFNDVWVFTSGLDSGHMDSGVPSQLQSVKLLFKNKLSVSILGLYTGVSSVVWFSQTGKINSFIAKTVNESFFIILGGDFNEDGLHKCASFKKCLDLGLVNSLLGILEYSVIDVTISVLVGLGGLLDVQLNSFCKQANKDCWKFNFKDADNNK
ncbi:hypothetical protein G9A89_011732 [Geosiphon pyriformis]|nr:hypothetical protein G9A89_011732 [Geosiphon pyriformis]